MTAERPPYDPVSVSPLAFWSTTAEEREKSFRILRDERPLSWHPPIEGSLMASEQDGFWAFTRHADVVAVNRNPADFCSSLGIMMEEIPENLLEATQSIIAMDAPRHTAVRKIVSAAFTPKQIARIEQRIQAQAARIVDDLLTVEEGDFVAQVSKRLPMWTIYEMIGLPHDRREDGARYADELVSWADPDVAAGRHPGEVLNDAIVGLHTIARDMITDRRAQPRDDLMTNLVQAEVDGQRLTDDEIAAFFVLLSIAGNNTTRNSTTVGMKAFCDFPDQRKLLADSFDPLIGPAIDEIVRFVTPVMTFRRTATRDVQMYGQTIREGDWVVIMLSSANRDERVFAHPDIFDIQRSPNPHVAFGGGGPHYCMGKNLARTQMRALFGELLRRAPNLELGEPSYLVGNFVRAVTAVPYRLHSH